MASTYVNNLRLNEMATGDGTGTWGTTTNKNLELIADAFGYGTRVIADAPTDNITMGDGVSDTDRSMYLKLTGGGQACTVSLLPNTSSKVWIMENATSYPLTFTCGTGTPNIVILAGEVKMIATDGGGGDGIVYDVLTDVNLAGTTKVVALIASGAITGSSTIQGTTITATDAFVPDASDGAALGTTSLEFSDLYLADGAVIGFGDDQEVTLTHVHDAGLLLSSTDQLQFGDAGSVIYQSGDGILRMNGEVTIDMYASGSVLVSNNLQLNSDASVLGFGVNNDVTLTHVHDTGLLLNDAMALQFHDASQYINAPSATVLDINATDEIELNATAVDLNGTLDVSGTSTLTGNVTMAGDLAVDGTANLDEVDIDGAVQVDSTITVGVDDTGYDVKFFGATASAYMLWDESADDLILAGAAGLVVDGTTDLDNTDIDGTLVVDGSNISLDSTSTLNIDNSNTSNGITVGTATSGVPVSIGHTTSEVTVNDNLTVTGTLTLGSGAELTEAELEMLDGVTAGTVAASKAVVVDSNKDIASFRNVTLTGELDAGSLDVEGDADINGTLETDALSINGTTVSSTATELNILDGVTSTTAELNILDGVTSTAAELNILDGVTSTTAELNILDGATVVVGEVNYLDLGSTAVGTAIASKAVVLDSNKDYTGIRNLTITGELDAATLDISGAIDVAGTANLDVVDIDGAVDMASTLQVDGAITGSSTIQGTTITATTAFVPDASDGAALGSASLEFSDLFLADGAVVSFGDDDDVTLTHVHDTGLLLNSTRQLQFGDSGSYIQQSVDGTMRINGEGVLDLYGSSMIAMSNDVRLNSDASVLGFGVNNDVTLTHVHDTGLLLNSTMALQFNDASQYINAPSNAILDITATDEIELNATAIDLNGTLDVSGTITVAGNADFNGDLDVNGTTNLDVVDIDGAVDMATTALVTGVLTTTATQVATGGITSGSDIISDTDGTDSLGSTGVRWLKGWFDTLTAGTLTIGSGSVTDSSGAISFGNENLTTTGIVTAAGTSVFTNLDISGDVDVDGTTNLDVVDIDGAVDMASTLAVTGDVNIDSRTLYVDTSTDRVAVNSPSDAEMLANFTVTDATNRAPATSGNASGHVILGNTNNYGMALGATSDPGYTWIQAQALDSAGVFRRLCLNPAGGNVGVNMTAPTVALHVTGAITATGAITGSSKSFKIDHPLDSMKDTHDLFHVSVESPRADLQYRGVVTLSGGTASVDLDESARMSDGTWEALCRDPQVFLQNDTGWSALKGSISGSTLIISCENTNSTDTVSWMVVAERDDPTYLASTITDDDGLLIIEAEKPEDVEDGS
jgi:cytoskeletal protein CcmA (bactofilin family)